MKPILLLGAALLCAIPARAHDIWVEANTNLYRVGDVAHLDLKLGNHGNEHRDFKLASKLDPTTAKMQIIAPDGKSYDLNSSLHDTGYTPKEGFWRAAFTNDRAGLYCVSATTDGVMSYAPERSIKNAKTFFIASKSLDRVPFFKGHARRVGAPLELVPESSPVAPMGPDVPLTVRLYFKGKPMAGARVSFIPEGETLRGKMDARYEKMTNVNGRATFTPREGKRYLVVAHHRTPERGKDYTFTKYSATLTLYVPQICPCCGG